MEKGRSKAVTVFAWLVIILNIFSLFSLFDFQGYFACFKSLPANFIKIVILYSMLSPAIGIIAGFGLLKLKNIMRITAIALNGLDSLFGIPLFFLTFNDIKQYFHLVVFSELAKSPLKIDINLFANFIFYLAVSAIWIVFAFNILFIYFFTRPRVKEEFK